MNFSQKHSGDKFHTESRTQNVLTVAIGVLLGATVTLTSIGAGALGTVTFLFYTHYGYTSSWNRSRRSINLSSWFRTSMGI
jgi:uncharacterized protein (DUF2062 family)